MLSHLPTVKVRVTNLDHNLNNNNNNNPSINYLTTSHIQT